MSTIVDFVITFLTYLGFIIMILGCIVCIILVFMLFHAAKVSTKYEDELWDKIQKAKEKYEKGETDDSEYEYLLGEFNDIKGL